MRGPRDALTTDDGAPALAPSLGPGTVIADRYRIEARLGAGGGGTVWRCLDQKLDAIVALKIVSADGDLERWRREVAMARRIADRNVCRVHDLGETADLRFVTMELVEGESLRSRIRADLPAVEARALFTQIAGGVAAIHAAGVVHRDLKPENVVVATDGRAVIVDFGLAREPRKPGEAVHPDRPGSEIATAVIRGPTPQPQSRETVTNAGTVVGTPRYMSPEQAAGEVVDARTDVWALGLIGHELLTGAMPMPDAHGRKIDPAVDDKLPGGSAILRRCLGLLPDERYPDARALAAALHPKRRRWPIVAIGIAIVAALAGVVVYLAQNQPSAEHAVPYTMLQVTTTKQWPRDAPISVALSPDGKRFAYTTAGAELFVRDLAGGAADSWTVPKLPPSGISPDPQALVTILVAGWLGDGSLALVGTAHDGQSHLLRVYRDKPHQALHDQPERLVAAVSTVGDRIAISSDEAISTTQPGKWLVPLAPIAPGERIVALAWSPDGSKLASARFVGRELVLHVIPGSGGDPIEVWRGGSLDDVDPLLVWTTGQRLGFTYRDPRSLVTTLATIDTETKAIAIHETLERELVGAGSAANGTVLLLRGTAAASIQLRGRKVEHVHTDSTASRPAGWTTEGRLVFLEGSPGRIVVAEPGKAPAPWPNTSPGVEQPDTVIDNDVIAHLPDPADATKLLVVQIAPNGGRTQLARIDAHPAIVNPVRCAGDRATPCVIEQVANGKVTWTELDLDGHTLGRLIHTRALRGSPSAALSPDGGVLAVADGQSEVTLIERATGQPRSRPPSGGKGASVQSVGFAPDGDLWVTSRGGRGRQFNLMSFNKLKSGHYWQFPSASTSRDDLLTAFDRPTPRGSTGTKDLIIATAIRDFHLDLWRAEGL